VCKELKESSSGWSELPNINPIEASTVSMEFRPSKRLSIRGSHQSSSLYPWILGRKKPIALKLTYKVTIGFLNNVGMWRCIEPYA